MSDPDLSVLHKGLNFAVTPKRLPVIDLVTATESACRQLGGGDKEELRSKVVNILSRGDAGLARDQNITKKERDALDSLKKDEKRQERFKCKWILIFKKNQYRGQRLCYRICS